MLVIAISNSNTHTKIYYNTTNNYNSNLLIIYAILLDNETCMLFEALRLARRLLAVDCLRLEASQMGFRV